METCCLRRPPPSNTLFLPCPLLSHGVDGVGGKQGLTAKEEGLSFTNGPSRRQASRSTLVKGDLKRVCSPPLFLRARRMRGKAENRKK